MKYIITSFLFLLIVLNMQAQAPQGIPYQAVIRNLDGSVIANSTVNLAFIIHDGNPNGTAVYQENHTLNSSDQGLVTCIVGNGVVSLGNFENISWGNGEKFMQVLMENNSVQLDLGTQQMMSTPYALYTGSTHVSVSASGDSLTIGKHTMIVPGVSAANQTALYTMGSGVTDFDGNYYNSIIINGQEWMQENLKTTHYRNGTNIPMKNSWAEPFSSISSAMFSYYYNVGEYNNQYGKLYNGFVAGNPLLCPTGWHVPSFSEWTSLIDFLGGPNTAWNKLKSTTGWSNDQNGTNESGFNARPGGYRDDEDPGLMFDGIWYDEPIYEGIGVLGVWYSSTSDQEYTRKSVRSWNVNSYASAISPYFYSIRCVKD
jgi:uncharacterized protein (TIGR02145 family)